MMRFYFNLKVETGVERDREGVLLPDVFHAYLEACQSIPAIAAEFIREGRNPMGFAFEITNTEGDVLMSVPFNELVAAQPARRG